MSAVISFVDAGSIFAVKTMIVMRKFRIKRSPLLLMVRVHRITMSIVLRAVIILPAATVQRRRPTLPIKFTRWILSFAIVSRRYRRRPEPVLRRCPPRVVCIAATIGIGISVIPASIATPFWPKSIVATMVVIDRTIVITVISISHLTTLSIVRIAITQVTNARKPRRPIIPLGQRRRRRRPLLSILARIIPRIRMAAIRRRMRPPTRMSVVKRRTA